MARHGYRFAIQWVALNDESAERDAEVLADLPSALLVADMFGKLPSTVGNDIAKWKMKHDKEE